MVRCRTRRRDAARARRVTRPIRRRIPTQNRTAVVGSSYVQVCRHHPCRDLAVSAPRGGNHAVSGQLSHAHGSDERHQPLVRPWCWCMGSAIRRHVGRPSVDGVSGLGVTTGHSVNRATRGNARPTYESTAIRRRLNAGSIRVRKIAAPQLFVAIDLLLGGIAVARNHHCLQLWRLVA